MTRRDCHSKPMEWMRGKLAELVDDPSKLPNTPGAPCDESRAVHYPDYGPPEGGIILAEGAVSFRFYRKSGEPYDAYAEDERWLGPVVRDFLIDDFVFQLECMEADNA